MKFNFKKIGSVLASAAMIGATAGFAAAATNYPAPFSSGDYAIVIGSNEDMAAATTIGNNLGGGNVVSMTPGEGVTETEVPLGGVINFTSSKIPGIVTDSKVTKLLDTQISWDDGVSNEDYDVHEEIVLSDVQVKTTSYDNDYDESVALTSNKGILYKYVFEDAINTSRVGSTDAEDLYLEILGKEYEIISMSSTSITVYTSEETSLAEGDSYSFGGANLVVDRIFDGKAQVNGQIISEGSSKVIDGVRVKVDTVGFNSNNPDLSVVILRVGDEISKQYASGEEYVGEDEDQPRWVWEISNPGVANGYIGVKYNFRTENYNDDDIKYIGDSYVLPENYAQITLVGTTDVGYDDIELSFERGDLWNSTSLDSVTPNQDNVYYVTIGGPENADDTFTVNSKETDQIYILYAVAGSETEGAAHNGTIEVFYRDVNKDVTNAILPRYASGTALTSQGTLAKTLLGTVEYGDTDMNLYVTVTTGNAVLSFNDTYSEIQVDLGGVALANTTGALKWLGGDTETTSSGAAETGDVVLDGSSVGKKENNMMDNYGVIIKEPEANADNDKVILSIPDDRVYAEVFVGTGEGSESAGNSVVVTDSDMTMANKEANLIVVGGSCINSVAAELLFDKEDSVCGSEFSLRTQVAANGYLIETFASPYADDKIATLVAGYEKEDTVNAANALISNMPSTAVGAKIIGPA